MATVLNQTAPIQIDVNVTSDPTLVWVSIAIASVTAFFLITLVWVSIAIASVTAFFLILNSRTQRHQLQTMQRQVQLVENEMKERLRAWIGTEGYFEPKFVSTNKGNMDYDGFLNLPAEQRNMLNVDSILFETYIKNFGSLPATDIYFSLKLKDDLITKNNIDKSKLQMKHYHSLPPNGTGKIFFEMPIADWNSLRQGKELYLLLYMQYSYANSQRADVGYIYRMWSSSLEIIESWNE